MDRRSVAKYAYVMFLILVGSIFSMSLSFEPVFGSHSDIEEVRVDNTAPDPGDSITISGIIDNANEDEDVDITIHEPGGGSDTADTTINSDVGDFEEIYDIPDPTDDGVYEVEVEFGSEDPMSAYFLIDEEDDDAPTETNNDSYEQGDDVEITGEVPDPETGVEDVDIIVLDPTGEDVGPGSVDLDSDNQFEYTLELADLDDEGHLGTYGVIVEHDGNEAGWAVFEVVEGSGSGDNEITATLTDATLEPGGEVEITGSIAEDDVDQGEEVFLTVDDPDGTEIEDQSVEPDSDGDFTFTFDLDSDAEEGTYDITLQYVGYDDKLLSFTVSSDGGPDGGSGNGSDSGLTARLSKTSLLAGETITVSGVVPRVIDDPVNISVLRPDGTFVAASFPDPSSDETYSATIRLPSTLEEDEDYSVIVSYDDKEVEVFFDITGTASGSTGAITVQTDKPTYSTGSTVEISGEIADDTFVPGNQIALQVYNPNNEAYRFDPIIPESDGSYSYSMVVGGPLGVTGEWDVRVTYAGQVAETTFDLTGGVASKPRYDLRFENFTFPIEYESDGSIISMYLRPAEKKLVIAIDGEQEGRLTIKLPRQVIDAVQGGSDIKYVVSTLDTNTGDQRQINATESLTASDARTIAIDYAAGTDLIEIQGTTIVPEFGPLAAIVLAIAVISIIAVTAKFTDRMSAFGNH